MTQTFYTAAVLKEHGKLSLDHLPFGKGEAVRVFLSAAQPATADPLPLRGTVIQYERPTEPVAGEDWEALK